MRHSKKPRPKSVLETAVILKSLIPPQKLGNLLGALSNWVDLQNDAKPGDTVIYSTVGYHAITMPQDPETLRRDRRNSIAALLAIGLDVNKSIIFPQHQASCSGYFTTCQGWVLIRSGSSDPGSRCPSIPSWLGS